MRSLKIGDVARAVGIAPSAIRYYERCGLLPAPRRQSRQRRYAPEIVGHLQIIATARDAGMSVAEILELMTGFPRDTTPAERWQTMATRKRDQLDALEARVKTMKTVLETHFRCGCPTLEICAQGLSKKRLSGRGTCA